MTPTTQQSPRTPVMGRARRAFAEFFRLEAAGGIELICAAVLALVCVNTGLADTYNALLDVSLGINAGQVGLEKPLLLWINDGLMAVFFLLVALEIKREMVGGQLSTRAQLMLPMVCAVAGVAVPALIFVAFNRGDASALRGWAVPTATDIAFALGAVSYTHLTLPTTSRV